ncbi:hypothetical protein AAEX28_01600 [Lentisphaerota bacterium WC36G]|nr:hypothetical protein LJT99_04485 [Lentisphaerae bacterium WC36]
MKKKLKLLLIVLLFFITIAFVAIFYCLNNKNQNMAEREKLILVDFSKMPVVDENLEQYKKK